MKDILYKTKTWGLSLALGTLTLASCIPDSDNASLGDLPTASFTVETFEDKPNKVFLKSTSDNAGLYYWDLGNGKFKSGLESDTVFFPDMGDYQVSLVAMGSGGIDTATYQTVTIATSDPEAGNLITGGNMDDPDTWTPFTITDGVSFVVADGKMTATGGAWGHGAIYQALEVVAGRNYGFNAEIAGSGSTDTWYEVYFGTEPPVDGADYTSGGNRLGLNTWDGCATASFDGDFLTVACNGDLAGTDGVLTFETSGTVYLVIKSGGGDLGVDGISIDNIEFRGVKE